MRERWSRARAAVSLELLAVGVVERERNRSGGDDAGLGVAGLLDMVNEGDGKEDSGTLGKMQRRRGVDAGERTEEEERSAGDERARAGLLRFSY